MISPAERPRPVAAPWHHEITRQQWRTLLAGQLGFALDAFDVMLYAFCLPSIMKAWSLPPATAGFLLTVTLLSSSIGGVLFGAIADRAGRKRALMLTVIVFSACSGLSGLAQTPVQLGVARALLGLGMGGEWAAGVLLVAETWPPQHRGKAIAFVQSGWAVGYILAAIAAATVLPAFGWRVMFFLGVVPALFTVWVRAAVEEPKAWLEARRARVEEPRDRPRAWAIFRRPLLRFTLLSTLTSAFVMFGNWGVSSWMPSFLAAPVAEGGAGLGVVKAPLWTVPMMSGAFFGYLSFGFIADRFGRRPTFAAYLFVAAALVGVFGSVRDPTMLLVLGPFVGFFGHGYFSAFGAFLSELFPTHARGAAVGFCYNAGRMLSAFAPTLVGALSTAYGLGGALAALSIAFLGGGLSIFLLPETRGRELTDE